MPNARSRSCFAVISAILLLASGCTTYKSADPQRAKSPSRPISSDAWPHWDTTPLLAVQSATPDFLPAFEFIPDFPEADRDPKAQATLDRTGLVIEHNAISTGGLFRAFTDRAAKPESDPTRGRHLSFPEEPNASFLSVPGYASETAQRRAEAAIYTPRDIDMTPYFVKGLRRAKFGKSQIALDGTLQVQLPEINPESRGILIHLPGLIWSEQEAKLVETLRHNRWSVATIESKPWVTDPNAVERAAARASRSLWIQQQREAYEAANGEGSFDALPWAAQRHTLETWFTQSYIEVKAPASGFSLTSSTDTAELGERIAVAVDEAMTLHAYAAEAVVAYMDSRDPTLAPRPIVVVGLSAGALVAPTVAARLRELHGPRLAALVDIAGGADLFAISRKGSLSDGGIELAPRKAPQPPAGRVARVHESYLEYARLDPYYTAAALHDLPVLVVAARRDTVIPFSSAELLIERLARPDRILTFGDHPVLYWLLPEEAHRIARWINRHADAPPSAR